MPATKYGDCSAYLFISRAYGVDYGDVLAVADFLTHNRQICRPFNRLFLSAQLDKWAAEMESESDANELLSDIGKQVARFKELRAGIPSAPQTEPMGVVWWTPESAQRYLPAYS